MATLKSFLDGIDLIAARLRGPLRALAGLGIAFQGAMASGAWKAPEKWSHGIAALSIVLAYFTTRGAKEVVALDKAKAIEDAPPTVGHG
jgi:hypothetical protein